ncbi:aldehyde dehydrogenase family protein [Pseudonocardia alni]|uniref:aldehyde dehydrogenase family protein n=1 Tax=Pseudonocardia alni TaxID=33907 RepID=UPI00332E139D
MSSGTDTELATRWQYDGVFADGGYVRAESQHVAEIVAPRNEEVIGRVPLASRADVDRVVASARRAFDTGPWPLTAPAERAAVLRRWADLLQEHENDFALLAVEETGTPTAFNARGATSYPAFHLRNFADACEGYAFEQERTSPFSRAVVIQEGVGVVAAIPSFNSPVGLGVQKIGGALAAGCTVVLKAPVQDPLGCHLLVELGAAAGLPPGALNLVVAEPAESEYLVTRPGVDLVSFTGSTGVGKHIAALCAADVRRCVLELGGKSAAIILEDADLDAAVATVVRASVAFHMGEACTAMSRVLVPRSRHDEIADALAGAIAALPVGDPTDPQVLIGPLITAEHRARVERYIEIGREEGATVRVGGGRPAGLSRGWYVEPTLFTGVDNSMRIAREEIFGPATAVIAHDGLEHALQLANDTPFGLSGTVFTADPEVGLEVARKVRAGTFSVNDYIVDQTLPFGGYRQSGLGRENGERGMTEFLETKSVTIGRP